MSLDDASCQRQAEPDPVGLGREERSKRAARHARRHADAGILDRDLDRSLLGGTALHTQAASLGHRFDGIADNAAEGMRERRATATNRRQRSFLQCQLDTLAPKTAGDAFKALATEPVAIDLLGHPCRTARGYEKLPHPAVAPICLGHEFLEALSRS